MRFLLALGLAVAGCGGATADGTRPDDMSAEEHREAARAEEQRAEAHEERREPGAASMPRARSSSEFYPPDLYDPTQVHSGHAHVHEEHAEAHRQAAQALEQFEQEQCASFPAETRSSCPLLGTVTDVEEIEGGVRVRFAEDANVEAITAHVRCHFAYARTQGYEGMDACPLYLEGVSIRRVEGEPAVELTVDERGRVEELRARARAHVVAP